MKAIALVALTFLTPAAHASDLCLPATRSAGGVLHAKVCEALAAVDQKDRATLRELMASDFSLLGVTGKYFGNSRDDMVTRWTSGSPDSSASSARLVEVYREHVKGNAGFIAGEIEDRVDERGKRTCHRHAFTDFWERRGNTWVWVQSHESGAREAPCTE